jgi:hypothetical protein
MINEQGGINGRRITFITYDDGFSPPARNLAESPTQCSDLHREIALLDRQAGPRRVDQRVLRDWHARPLNQGAQQRHRSLADRQRFRTVEQGFGVRVQTERPKSMNRRHRTM